MSDIVGKLGILPLKSHSVTGPMNLKYEVCYTREVRQLEQQKNEMFEALIELIHGFKSTEGSLYHIIERAEKTIQKTDPKHRSWEEIEELL